MHTLVLKPIGNGSYLQPRVLDNDGEVIPFVDTVELTITAGWPHQAIIWKKDEEAYTTDIAIRIDDE